VILPVPGDELRNALVDGGGRLETVVAFDRADVGEGLLHVADLHRERIADRRPSGFLLEQLDDAHEVFAAAVADIVERVRARAPAGLLLAVVGE